VQPNGLLLLIFVFTFILIINVVKCLVSDEKEEKSVSSDDSNKKDAVKS